MKQVIAHLKFSLDMLLFAVFVDGRSLSSSLDFTGEVGWWRKLRWHSLTENLLVLLVVQVQAYLREVEILGDAM